MNKDTLIENFIPNYPSLDGEDFGYEVARKKEFYDLRLERSEPSGKTQGELLNHQKFMKRFFSPNTPYDKALIFGRMGTGKCVHPDTILPTSQGTLTAKEIWDKYKDSITYDREGEWSLPLEKILVWSFSDQKESYCVKPIAHLYRQYVSETLVNIELENGCTIIITKLHKLRNHLTKEWTTDFHVGDYISAPLFTKYQLVGSSSKSKIKSLTEIIYNGYVYDFEVEEHHNYVANGILCHNTCVSSAIAEAIKNTPYGDKPRKPALVFVKSEDLRESYMNEIANVCTAAGTYKPEETENEKKKGAKMTEGAKLQRLHKAIKKNYKIVTYEKFLKNLEDDETLRQKYNGCDILIDEAHVLKIQPPRKVSTLVTTKKLGDDEILDEIGDLEGEDEEDLATATRSKIQIKDAVMLYKQMHHFLHTISGCRILLFTGTPIWDQTYEIASLMNLILDKTQQLPTGIKFERQYFDENGILTEEGSAILKERFQGKVSFLREMVTTAKRTEMGTVKPWLKYVKVFPCQMSEFQAAYAREARENAVTKVVKNKKGKVQERIITGGTVKKLAIDSMNMVLPVWDKNGEKHGEYGPSIFKKYTEFSKQKIGAKNEKKIITQFKLSDKRLIEELKNNLAEYNAKLATIINHAKEHPDEVIFIYNEHVTGPGGVLMSALIMDLHGFSQARSAADIASPSTKKRFAVITAHEQTIHEVKQIQDLLTSHNKADNCYGGRLQIIFGSEKIALGFTIKHVRRVYIQTPHWNIPAIEQAMARGFRFGSHDALKPEERFIKIFRLVAVEEPDSKKGGEAKGKGFPPEASFSSYKTMDIEVYSTAEKKEHKNTQIYRLLKEASFDCALNYGRNVLPEDVDGTRDCDYQKCNYTCDGYPEDKINKEGNVYDYSIPEEDLDYSTYNLLYSDEIVKSLRESIKKLFGSYFSLSFEMVVKLLDIKDENIPSLLNAIDSLIETRSLIRNRYGFGCYLKEQGDILFLDNSVSPKANYPESSYIENPLVTEKMSMDIFVEILELENDKEKVLQMCKSPSSKIYDSLSHKTKIILLEASYVISKTNKKGLTPKAVNSILEFSGKSLHKTSDGKVIHILYSEEFKGIAYDVAAKDIKVTGQMREYDPENEFWKYTDPKNEEKYVKELKEKLAVTVAVTKKEADNGDDGGDRGVSGWIAEKDKKFRVQLQNKKGVRSRGKKCPTFEKPDLIDIFVKNLEYFPETKDEFKNMKKKDLLLRIKGKVGFDEYKEDIDSKDEDYLRGFLTILTMSKQELCDALEQWFKENNLLTTK